MNRTPQPEPARTAGPPSEPARARPSAVVVPFPAGARPRRAPAADEARGEILLFLGVRYERLAS
jgi:hypothetical protein